MKRILFIALLIFLILAISGCSHVTIENIIDSPDFYVGKKVVIEGAVTAPLYLSNLKGFIMTDDKFTIMVSSDEMPGLRDNVEVTGTVVEGVLIPHYIYADKIKVLE